MFIILSREIDNYLLLISNGCDSVKSHLNNWIPAFSFIFPSFFLLYFIAFTRLGVITFWKVCSGAPNEMISARGPKSLSETFAKLFTFSLFRKPRRAPRAPQTAHKRKTKNHWGLPVSRTIICAQQWSLIETTIHLAIQLFSQKKPQFITARIRSFSEGNVFSRVCVSVHRGSPCDRTSSNLFTWEPPQLTI